MYATTDDVQARIPEALLQQLTSSDGQSVDTGKIDAALRDAGSVIQGYLERAPVNSRPSDTVLRPYAIDIAIYRLAQGRPGQNFESVKAAHDEAVRFLSRIAEGRLPDRGVADSDESGSEAGSGVAIAGPEPTMTRENLDGL